MGNCASTPAGGSPDNSAVLHREAERQMRETKKVLTDTAKVLLLGTGDSGKTTILKQMQFINRIPWTSIEIESYRQIIWANIIEGMRRIREVMDEFNIETSEDNIALFDQVFYQGGLGGEQPYPPQCQHILQTFWDDPAVQEAVSMGKKLALPDNLPYFFNDLPRLFTPTYSPSTSDIMFAHVRTLGIHAVHFTMPGPPRKRLMVVDVGGQKSERRKWIHCFEDVTAILFLVSLSGYDQSLIEERNANQMMDAMGVWDSICSSQWFRTTSLILFLNKADLFRERIQHSPIRKFFPDYDGPEDDADAGMQYFRRRFVQLAQKANKMLEKKEPSHGERDLAPPLNARRVYTHFTNAVDIIPILVLLSAVFDTILRDHFEKSAIL